MNSYALYGTKYGLTFTDHECRTVVCQIKKYGYSGASTTLKGGEKPLIIGYESEDNQNKYEPFKPSYATVNFIVENDADVISFRDFYSSDAREWLLNVTVDGDVFWRGFIVPDTYDEPYTAVPFELSVSFKDSLGFLKTQKAVNAYSNNHRGYQIYSVWDILSDQLSHISELGLNVRFACNMIGIWQTPNAQTNYMQDQWVCATVTQNNANKPYGDISEMRSAYDVMRDILLSYGMTIFQRDGAWNIIRVDMLYDQFFYIQYNYLLQNPTYGSTNYLNQIGAERSSTNIYPINDSVVISKMQAWSTLKFTLKPMIPKDCILGNIDLNSYNGLQQLEGYPYASLSIDNNIMSISWSGIRDGSALKYLYLWDGWLWTEGDNYTKESSVRCKVRATGLVPDNYMAMVFAGYDYDERIDNVSVYFPYGTVGTLGAYDDIKGIRQNVTEEWTEIIVPYYDLGSLAKTKVVRLMWAGIVSNNAVTMQFKDFELISNPTEISREIVINQYGTGSPREYESSIGSIFSQTYPRTVGNFIKTVPEADLQLIWRGGLIGNDFDTEDAGTLYKVTDLTWNLVRPDGTKLYTEYAGNLTGIPINVTGKEMIDLFLDSYKKNYQTVNWKLTGTYKGRLNMNDILVYFDNRRFIITRCEYDAITCESSIEAIELVMPPEVIPGTETAFSEDWNNDWTI